MIPRLIGRVVAPSLVLAAGVGAQAQQGAPASPRGAAIPAPPTRRARVWLVPRADSVFVFVVDAPARRGSFTVARALVGGGGEGHTPRPVRAAGDPAEAMAGIGGDLPAVLRATGASDETQLVRRLTSDDFTGTLTSALWRSVALAMGRLWVDAGVQRGAEYEYRVTWLGADGAPDPRRPALVQRVRVADAALAPPAAVAGKGADHGATLTWRYPRYAGDPRDAAIAFTVWRADDAAGPFHRVSAAPIVRDDAAPRMTFADSGLRAGVRYRYDVRALDVAGREGTPSGEVVVVPVDRTLPAAPAGLVARAGDGRVTLAWRLGADADLAGWYVERTLSLDAKWTRLTTRLLPLGQPTWVDTAVAGPWQHFYRVVAVDSAGNESRPGSIAVASPADRDPPAAPSALGATVAGRRLALRWRPSPSRDVIGYYVYRADDTTRLVRLTPRPIAATQFTDSGYGGAGLAPGGTYAVAVAAVDRAYNESPRVVARVAVPDDQPPEPPTGLLPTNVLGRRIDLAWTASPSRDVVAYVVTRTSPGDSARALGRVAAHDRLALRDTVALVHGRGYVYRVVAVDGAGNRSAPRVDSVRFVDPDPPSPTRDVHATLDPSGRGVLLRWERVVDGELAGFHVYRGTLPTAATERLTTTPVRDLRFVDAGGRAEHWYVVRAVDRSGNESRPSDPVRAVAGTRPIAADSAARSAPRARPPAVQRPMPIQEAP